MTDLPDTLGLLGARLRQAGLPADAQSSAALIRALGVLDPLDPTQVRAASRALHCTSRAHLSTHDRVFDSVFGLRRVGRTQDPTEVIMPRPELGEDGDGPGDGQEQALARSSSVEYLRHVDLGRDGTEAALRLIDSIAFVPPRGSAHRHRRSTRGVVDAPAVLRQLVRSEEISSLPRRRPRHRQRPVTVVADVSASMTPWRAPMLRFLRRCVSELSARCFTAGTRLTRVDHVLGQALPQSGAVTVPPGRPPAPTRPVEPGRPASGSASDPGAAIASIVTDAAAGTRLGQSLLTLLDSRTKDHVRGSVLVVISDGWEHGDCAELALACARLSRLSHRFIWVNPRAGRPGFAPLTTGLRIVADHADAVLPATTAAGWQTVAEAMAGARISGAVRDLSGAAGDEERIA